MKTFEGDFYKFLDKIKKSEHFSLSRWGDGELIILENKKIDIRKKGNGEFRYDPDMPQYAHVRDLLSRSYVYQDDEYYIGVACPCCVGDKKYQYMKKTSLQDEEHLTWANIFVNSNYSKFLDEYIPEFSNHKINIVVNGKSKVSKLPFSVNNIWYVGTDAWYTNDDISSKIANYIAFNDVKDEIFLFACGPLANILTYELWYLVSKQNTYIDIGSVLDPMMGLKLTRGYHLGAPTLKKVCVW